MNEKAGEEILNILSRKPEELKHAKDTLNWLMKINPNSDFILRISALGHDIERVVYSEDKKKYPSHKDFKMAHSRRSAEIIRDILLKNNIGQRDIQKIENIILNHEFGGDFESNLIKDADSLANFQWCDDMRGIIDEKSLKETMKRMLERMEDENKRFIKQLNFNHAEVEGWLKKIIS